MSDFRALSAAEKALIALDFWGSDKHTWSQMSHVERACAHEAWTLKRLELQRKRIHEQRAQEQAAQLRESLRTPAEKAVALLRQAYFDPRCRRIIEGVASSDARNSHGESKSPQGARYSLPIPLLWGHDWDLPIGLVMSAETSGRMLKFSATIANSGLNQVNDIWQHIKSGRALAVSVAATANSAGKLWRHGNVEKHFANWNWEELSVLPLGANPDAVIECVKEVTRPAVVHLYKPQADRPKEVIHYDARIGSSSSLAAIRK